MTRRIGKMFDLVEDYVWPIVKVGAVIFLAVWFIRFMLIIGGN